MNRTQPANDTKRTDTAQHSGSGATTPSTTPTDSTKHTESDAGRIEPEVYYSGLFLSID